MAIDQKNAAGGIGGQKVIYQEFDNASPVTGLPDEAVTASTARQMVADSSIYAVVGGANSSQTKIDLPLFASDGLVMLSGSSTNPDLTDPSMTQYRMPDGSLLFFRTVPNDKVLGPATAKYVHDDLGVNTVFFVDDGLAYGVGVGDQVEKTQAATGIKLIGRDRIDPQSADYSTLMTKINGLKPDGVMMVAGSGPAGKFAHQAKGVLTAKVLFGGDGVPDPGFIEQSAGASDGWIGVLGGPDITKLPAAQQFLKDFAAKYNSQPRSQDADYYEASTAALKAIESVVCAGQPLTRAAVRNALKTVSFDGVTGPVSFDVNGDRVVTTMSVWKDEGGVPVFVKTLSAGQ